MPGLSIHTVETYINLKMLLQQSLETKLKVLMKFCRNAEHITSLSIANIHKLEMVIIYEYCDQCCCLQARMGTIM